MSLLPKKDNEVIKLQIPKDKNQINTKPKAQSYD